MQTEYLCEKTRNQGSPRLARGLKPTTTQSSLSAVSMTCAMVVAASASSIES